jgi:hypothetical protein
MEVPTATVAGLEGIASFYDIQGPADYAFILTKVVYEKCIRRFGPTHEMSLGCGISLAIDYMSNDEDHKGIELLERVLQDSSAITGSLSELYTLEETKLLICSWSRCFLAQAYKHVGYHENTHAIINELEEELKTSTESRLYPLIHYMYLIVRHRVLDETAEFFQTGEEVLNTFNARKLAASKPGVDDSVKCAILVHLGYYLVQAGQIEKGNMYIQQALALNIATNGPRAPNTLASCSQTPLKWLFGC